MGPHQRFMSSGSVHAFQTSSRGASKTRSMTRPPLGLALGAAAVILKSDRMDADWARRFEWARALGHILLDSFRGGAVGAASSPYCVGDRRRRSGAFAAELLLPHDAIARVTAGVLNAGARPDLFAEIMRRFGTGARTTANHLFNHRFLSSPAVRDDLIDRFAAPQG